MYQPPNEAVHYWKTSGTTEQWRENVGYRCSGNSRLIMAVACSFAGPILRLVRAECGGIHFHGATSTGKSTSLIVGGSVCGGGGQSGFVQTWRSTINGLEAISEAHNDGTVFLDELSQVDPHLAAETAYLLGNGMGKNRMSRGMGTRKQLKWTLLYVSSGELTLAEHSASAGKRTRGGAEVRLLNIEADAGQGLGLFEMLHGTPTPDAFAHELKGAASRYYGAPFRAFVKRLTRDKSAVEDVVRAARDTFIQRFVLPGVAGNKARG